MARLLADVSRGQRAGRRTRHHRLHGIVRGDRARHRAAVALHHQELAAETGELQLLLQPAQVARHDRLDIAVQCRRAGALELADLAQDVGAYRDEGGGPDLARDGAGGLLVRGIGIGMDEADDQRLGAELEQPAHGGPHRVGVERDHHIALGVDALRHFEAQLARDQRLEAADHAVAEGPRAAAELQHIAEARSGDQAAARALAFENGVGADSGAVHQRRQVLDRDAAVAQSREHAARLVVGRRRDLDDAKPVRAFVDEQQVGESAAHVDAGLPFSWRGVHRAPLLFAQRSIHATGRCTRAQCNCSATPTPPTAAGPALASRRPWSCR